MTTLKPCPFCGGTNLETADVLDPGYCSVMCGDCAADGPAIYFEDHLNDDTTALAEAAWNERKLPEGAEPFALTAMLLSVPDDLRHKMLALRDANGTCVGDILFEAMLSKIAKFGN